MSYWETLGITPTKNRREIKAAYAKKLKKCKPEQDPRNFKILHSAYQAALEHCESEKIDLNTEHLSSIASASNVAREDSFSLATDSPSTLMPIEEFLQLFRELLSDFNTKNWEAFINSDELQDFGYRNDVRVPLFSILLENNTRKGDIPIGMNEKIELSDRFQWHHQEIELTQYFPAIEVENVLNKLSSHKTEINKKFIPTPFEKNELKRSWTEVEPIKLFFALSFLIIAFLGFAI